MKLFFTWVLASFAYASCAVPCLSTENTVIASSAEESNASFFEETSFLSPTSFLMDNTSLEDFANDLRRDEPRAKKAKYTILDDALLQSHHQEDLNTHSPSDDSHQQVEAIFHYLYEPADPALSIARTVLEEPFKIVQDFKVLLGMFAVAQQRLLVRYQWLIDFLICNENLTLVIRNAFHQEIANVSDQSELLRRAINALIIK